MKIVIDDKVCDSQNLPYTHLLLLLFFKTGADLKEVYDDMIEKEMIVEREGLLGKDIVPTQRWDDVCCNILLTSDNAVPDDERILNLARKLMEIYPKGKKPGTSTFWKGNAKDNTLRLKKFFKLYGNKYTDEQIIDATHRYIDSFNGRYDYMRVLKYFIWKDERKIREDGTAYIEEVSDLASFLENNGASDDRQDWNTTLR